MGFDIETGGMFPEGFPTPQTKTLNESSMMNEYKHFFEKYYNK